MEVRLATLNELDLLTVMNIQLRADEQIDNSMSENEVRERMEGFIKSNNYKCLLLVDDSRIVGYCLVDGAQKPIYVRQLFIGRNERSHGYGKKAIVEILRFFETKDLDIEVMEWNTRAIKFYEDNGFKKRYIGMRLNGSPVSDA